MLQVEKLCAGYRFGDVLHEISLEVQDGAIVGLLGPNGAGKTTLVRTITGLTATHTGRITFNNIDIQKMPAEKIVNHGVIHVPQGRMLFPDLTVEENLRLGAFRQSARSTYQESLATVHRYFPILKDRRAQPAGVLSGGEQQMLAIGRALMAQPRFLILDEPSTGLAPVIIDEIFNSLKIINKLGVMILIAEQNANKVLEIADFVYVLDVGRISHKGTSEELKKDDLIRKSFLAIT